MTEKPNRDLVDLLLERDVPLDDERYSRHRRNLEDQLRKAIRDERIVRISTLVAWGGALSYLPLALVLQRLVPRGGLPAGLMGDIVVPGLTLLTFACGALAIPLLALYLARYQRNLVRARDHIRDAVLLDLQKSVEQCQARLEKRDKST